MEEEILKILIQVKYRKLTPKDAQKQVLGYLVLYLATNKNAVGFKKILMIAMRTKMKKITKRRFV